MINIQTLTQIFNLMNNNASQNDLNNSVQYMDSNSIMDQIRHSAGKLGTAQQDGLSRQRGLGLERGVKSFVEPAN